MLRNDARLTYRFDSLASVFMCIIALSVFQDVFTACCQGCITGCQCASEAEPDVYIVSGQSVYEAEQSA